MVVSEPVKKDEFEKKFVYHFKKYGINFDEEIIKKFYIFYENIISENKKYNLTAITDADDMILKHFADSVMLLKYFDIPESAKIIDIGAGAGFPSVPLYIMRGDLKITVLDSSNKKINFVRNAIHELQKELCYPDSLNNLNNLNNLTFICGRAEDVARDKNFRESYDFAVSRAVAELNILCELALPMLRAGGYFFAYKGRNAGEEISKSESALKILGSKLIHAEKFDIYGSEPEEVNKRVLIQIKKIKNIPTLYPRNYAKITKSPL